MKPGTKTIVLIHGLWLTPKCWDGFRKYYESRGYLVHVPGWPGLKPTVQENRNDPSPELAELGVTDIADYYEHFVKAIDEKPILIGHSFGGLIVQMLLDRGAGACGVAIDSAPPKGILRLPFSSLKASNPVLSDPRNVRRTVLLSFEQFHYAFGNTMSEQQVKQIYDGQVIPGPGRVLFQAALANFTPHAATSVNFKNKNRAPLLLVAGTRDHLVPSSLVEDNYRKYKASKAITHFKEFPERSHLICMEDNWEEVADYCLSWAQSNTRVEEHFVAGPGL